MMCRLRTATNFKRRLSTRLSCSKRESESQLKRPRPARSKHLCIPGCGLTEGRAREITTIAGQVRLVVQVEYFADEREPPALVKYEGPAKAEVQRLEVVTER